MSGVGLMTNLPIVLYRMVQTCFTTRMPTLRKQSVVYRKAQRIMSDPSRVHAEISSPPFYWKGFVDGDHGTYRVIAFSEEFAQRMGVEAGRVACTCKSGQFAKQLCSHMIIAEEMRLQGEEEA